MKRLIQVIAVGLLTITTTQCAHAWDAVSQFDLERSLALWADGQDLFRTEGYVSDSGHVVTVGVDVGNVALALGHLFLDRGEREQYAYMSALLDDGLLAASFDLPGVAWAQAGEEPRFVDGKIVTADKAIAEENPDAFTYRNPVVKYYGDRPASAWIGTAAVAIGAGLATDWYGLAGGDGGGGRPQQPTVSVTTGDNSPVNISGVQTIAPPEEKPEEKEEDPKTPPKKDDEEVPAS